MALRIAIFTFGMAVIAQAATETPTNLTDKRGFPIAGKLRNIVGRTVYFSENGSDVTSFELDELSDASREEVLTWSLPFVLSNPRYFSFNSVEKREGNPSSFPADRPGIGRYTYQCTANNQSPMDLPADMQIAYNIHMLLFQAKPVDGTESRKYQYAFEHCFPERMGIAPSQVIASGKPYSFETTPFTQISSRFSEDTSNMSFEEIKSKTINVDPENPSAAMRILHKYVLEVRIYFKDEELFRYVDQPEAEALIAGEWHKPSLSSYRSDGFRPPSTAGRSTTPGENSSKPSETPEPESTATVVDTPPTPSIPVPPIPYESIVIIDVDNGTGTGFLMEMKGKQFLLTNIHVVAGAKSVTCKTVDGKSIQLPEQFYIAKDRDLALIPISFEGKYLQAIENLTSEVTIGDDVTVFGNEAGASVVTQLTGKVKGIGPERIEVDAKFVEGNSGSPAIHHKTGKVIGIAAYYIEYTLPQADRKGTDQSERQTSSESTDRVRRRFAERVDNPSEWERISFQQMRAERDLYNEYLETLDGIVEIAIGIQQNHRVIQSSESNKRVSHLLDDFHAVFRDNKHETGSLGNKRALEDLRRRMFNLVEIARERADNRISTQYYRNELKRMESFEAKVMDYMEGVYTK